MRPGGENGGIVNALCILALAIGTAAGSATQAGHTDAEQQQRQTCSPIRWDDDAGAEWETGWDRLMASGWVGRADDGMDAIYPPGCESVTS